jgi:hypothetical protein
MPTFGSMDIDMHMDLDMQLGPEHTSLHGHAGTDMDMHHGQVHAVCLC